MEAELYKCVCVFWSRWMMLWIVLTTLWEADLIDTALTVLSLLSRNPAADMEHLVSCCHFYWLNFITSRIYQRNLLLVELSGEGRIFPSMLYACVSVCGWMCFLFIFRIRFLNYRWLFQDFNCWRMLLFRCLDARVFLSLSAKWHNIMLVFSTRFNVFWLIINPLSWNMHLDVDYWKPLLDYIADYGLASQKNLAA